MLFSQLRKSLEWAVVLVVLTASLPLYGQTGGFGRQMYDEEGKPWWGTFCLIERQEVKELQGEDRQEGELLLSGVAGGRVQTHPAESYRAVVFTRPAFMSQSSYDRCAGHQSAKEKKLPGR